MRIVSYNILEGGAGREEQLARVIGSQRPDLVALIEADDPATAQRLADLLEMDLLRAPAEKRAVALLSRWPIIESVNHGALEPMVDKGFLEALVEEPSGREWLIGIVHLSGGQRRANEQSRLGQIARVLRTFEEHLAQSRPHLLCGDFNANSPRQRIDPQRLRPHTRQQWQENGGDLPREVVQKLFDAGYVDTLQAARPDEAPTVASFTTDHPGQRVDFIFSYGIDRSRIQSAAVIQDQPAPIASDHYPVMTEIR